MTEEQYKPTKAEMLAGLVSGNAEMSSTTATVQRSHRFPLHLFIQIENMARLGQVPISVIINELIDCGLEAVKQELPKGVRDELSYASKEQVERPTKNVRVEVKGQKPSTQRKTKPAK